MLETIHIQNYALIDDLEIELGAGFNALTGETGAGKSIIVDALSLVLGARASMETVREGAAKAKIDAVFRLAKVPPRLKRILAENEIELDGGELILTRTIGSDGRSRAHACGNIVPLSVLAAIGDELVDLHGQHEHQSLLQADRQLDLLDAYAGTEAAALAVADQVRRLRELDQQLNALEQDDRERERRIEFLRFEAGEIDKAGLTPGEEEEVRSRRNLITNAEKVYEQASAAYASLYEGEGSASDQLGATQNALEELADIDPRFQALVDQVNGIRTALEDAAAELREFTQEVEYDPKELDDLNRRISLIGDLKRKYGDTIDAILAYRAKALAEIDTYDQRDQHLDRMRKERAALVTKAQADAEALSKKRKEAAARLAKKVSAALQDLGMKGGTFEPRFQLVDLYGSGIDRVEFLLAANVGEKPKPLKQVASGGEISRVMLAMKAVFADADRIPTLIFDEIDAGVGGAVANQVAARMRQLAETHQVICITHLPQIAAAASAHFSVAKATQKKRTVTSVARMDEDSRVREVARLLDGSLSTVSLEHAKELLKVQGG